MTTYFAILFLVFQKIFWYSNSGYHQELRQELLPNFYALFKFISLSISFYGVNSMFYIFTVCNMNQNNFKRFFKVSYIFFVTRIIITIYGIKVINSQEMEDALDESQPNQQLREACDKVKGSVYAMIWLGGLLEISCNSAAALCTFLLFLESYCENGKDGVLRRFEAIKQFP